MLRLAACQIAAELLKTGYGKEIWALYETGKLLPDSELTGIFTPLEVQADLDEVMKVIDAATIEDAARRTRKAALDPGADSRAFPRLRSFSPTAWRTPHRFC
ncbi:MAG: hypothetical protein ACM3X0_13430 [Bacteroidota bacterium]